MSKPAQPLQQRTEAVRRFARERKASVVWLPSGAWFLVAHLAHVDSATLIGLMLLLIAPASCARIAINNRAELNRLRVLNSTYLDAKRRDEVAFTAGRLFERRYVEPLGEDQARGYSIGRPDERLPLQRTNGQRN